MLNNSNLNNHWSILRTNFYDQIREWIPICICLCVVAILSGCQSVSPIDKGIKQSNSSETQNQPNQEQLLTFTTALSYMDKKNYVSAEKLLNQLNIEQPKFIGPWINMGLLNLLQKRPVAAQKYVDKAYELDPKLPQTLNLMGLLATHNRQVSKAESYYKQALEYDNQYSNAHYNLALLFDIYLQDYEQAIVHYKRYLALVKNNDTETLNWLEQLESSIKQ
jgi:tetratricopeptide (TPR) repeat protein